MKESHVETSHMGQKKITLTELQRYLPLFPPKDPFSYPERIKRYMLSPSFSNLSSSEQSSIEKNYKKVYRNYYKIETVMQHLDQMTKKKYTLSSIRKAVVNSSERYGLIDWFKFVRIVRQNGRKGRKEHVDKKELVNRIKTIFRHYLKKKIVWKGIEEVQLSRKSLEDKLLKEFGNEAVRQVKEFIAMNRVHCQQILNQCEESYGEKLTFVNMEKIINRHLQIYLDKKKCTYLYLIYDEKNKGYFPLSQFVESLLIVPKQKKIKKEPYYLINFEQLMERIREQMKAKFYSANDMKNQYIQYEKVKAQQMGIQIDKQAQLNEQIFTSFIKQKCENKYSVYQINKVYNQILYQANLHSLFNRPNFEELNDVISKLTYKRKNKRVLKKENDIFYSFRTIILLLLTKSSQDKVKKDQFFQLIVKNDPQLKYQSFYAIWKVYPGIINVDRMRKALSLNKLSCYLKLRKTNEEYDKIYEQLLQQYPSSSEVAYHQVEEKINLNVQFVIETSKIKPLSYGDFDKVNYQECINQIFQPDFQIIMRAYIFRKVADKAYTLWKGRKERVEAERILNIKKKLVEIPKKKSIDSKQTSSRKLLTQKSKTSMKTRKSDESKMNPESLMIVKSNIQKLLNELPLKNKKFEKAFHRQKFVRKSISIAEMQKYIYRTLNPRVSLHMIPGIIGMGQNLLFLSNNKESRINLTIAYKPGIEVIDFTTYKDDVVLLTSYFILQFFSLSQNSNYPYRSLELLDEVSCLNNQNIDKICEDRVFSKYPVLIKNFVSCLGVNLSIQNNKVVIINPEKQKFIYDNVFNQKQHILAQNSLKILNLIKKHQKCQLIVSSILSLISNNQFDQDKFKQVLSRNNENEKGELLDDIAEEMENLTYVQLKLFIDQFNQYDKSIAICIIKQEFKLLKNLKIPDSFHEVIDALKEHMMDRNLSIMMILSEIDKQKQGVIMMKSLKDYLLKITQQIYMVNEKQIDSYLKNTVGKFIGYEGICEIMGSWNYAIWERPKFVITDFIFVKDSPLLIYTAEGSNNIFIKNLQDNKIIAIFPHHSTTPTITFIPERYLLISGDQSNIRLYRLFEDFIHKYDMNPPWTILQYAITLNAHDKMITSISYLSRAHCIVTTSLDSTVKFWEIEEKGSLVQTKRLYSYDHYYLTLRSGLTEVDGSNCKQEELIIGKIQKQINENNKYKYEFIVERYHVQNLNLQTGNENVYLEIPMKMKEYLQKYTYRVGKKKNALLSKKIKHYQTQINKITLINESQQKNLFNAVKKYFFFSQPKELFKIALFFDHKNNQKIYKILFEKYGLNIVTSNQQLSTSFPFPSTQAKAASVESQFQVISLPSDIYEGVMKKVWGKSMMNRYIKGEDLLKIGEDELYDYQMERLEKVIQDYYEENEERKEKQEVEIEFLKKVFVSYELDSDIDKLYGYLRHIRKQLNKKKMKVWQIFTFNKKDLEKITTITTKKFTQTMNKLNIPSNYTQEVISFLSKQNLIYLEDLLYYLKAAWEKVNVSLELHNFSQFMITNSRLIQSKFDSQQLKIQKEDNIEEVHETKKSVEDKLSHFEQELSSSKQKQSITEGRSIQKRARRSDKRDESEQVSKEKSQRKQKLSDSQKNKQNQVSSSASRITFSRDYTKDSFKRECNDIVKGIRQLLKNEGKTIWEIVSLSIPYFLEDPIITEQEYFNIYKSVKSPLKLSQKLKILSFMRRESSDGESIDLCVLFELFQHYKIPKSERERKVENWLDGEKYIITFLVNKLTENRMILQQSINYYFFREKEELSIEQILSILQNQPFHFFNFCLREFEVLLTGENKSAFIEKQIQEIIRNSMEKHQIKHEEKKVIFISELNYQISKNNLRIEDIFPKPPSSKVTLEYFLDKVKKLLPNIDEAMEHEFNKIAIFIKKKNQEEKEKEEGKGTYIKMRKPPKLQFTSKGEKNQLKYKDFIKYLQGLIQKSKNEENAEKQSIRKLLKALEINKINLFAFFVSLDRNKNFFINQSQFQIGLNELKIGNNFWTSIKKKHSKRLYYNELINYLVEKGMVNYKCVDSDLESAMSKFIKKYLKNEDIESVFERLKSKESEGLSEVNYESFSKALSLTRLFKDKQILIIYSAFVNSQNLKSSKFSNDDVIKDPSNVDKTFNFKMFTDTINIYKNENITKTPHYKFCDFLRKRNISIFNEFAKWMEKNKKIKQVTEAIKNKEQVLPKHVFELFVKEINPGLTDKEVKQMLASFPPIVDFNVFTQKIDQIYRKGNSNVEAEEINNFLQHFYKCIQKANATVDRLYYDFSKANKKKLGIKQFGEMSLFLQTGFSKIQNRFIFNGIDVEKKNYITLLQLQYALEEAGQTLEKQEGDYELDFILEKLETNKERYVLKVSRIPFSFERACIVFDKILTKEETVLVYSNAKEYFKGNDITEKNMEDYLIHKNLQAKAKKDKKYKELIINFLKLLKKLRLEVSDTYHYFSKDTASLPKNKFIILYQSLQLRASILQVNSLYSFLDEQKKGQISLSKWDERLNMINYEKQNMTNFSSEQLEVFYKVKVFLSELYLLFVRKMFKPKQIYSYFDLNNTGTITYQQLFSSITALGMVFDEDMEKRLTNYLDRQRFGSISINNLLGQFQNCINIKMKTVLQTKASCIFKQKKHLIEQKEGYFIQRLIEKERFEEIQGKWISCILQIDFIDIIKDFGIYLNEDESNDIRRNFQIAADNLQLYPLYFMFMNIFKSGENSLIGKDFQRERYNKLFQAMIKNGMTIKTFEKASTIEETSALLIQLKAFTPIEIKLLIQSITFPQTKFIDVDILKTKLRDSYLTHSENYQSIINFQQQEESETEIKKKFKSMLDKKKVVQVLKATSGKISLQTFQTMLFKIGCILTKKQVNKYFDIFSNNQQFIMVEDLLETEVKKMKEEVEEKKYPLILLDHIEKSLNFKGICLEQAWEKYYENYGYINKSGLMAFFNQIGFMTDIQTNQQHISSFLQKYHEQHAKEEIKCLDVERIMLNHQCKPEKLTNTSIYSITSQSLAWFRKIITNPLPPTYLPFLKALEQNLEEEGQNTQKISCHQFYLFLKKCFKNEERTQVSEESIKFIASLVIGNEISLKQLQKKLKKYGESLESSQVFIDEQPSTVSASKHEFYLKEISQKNFIRNYTSVYQSFYDQISHLDFPELNIYRISLNLLFEELIMYKNHLILCPHFPVPLTLTEKKLTISAPVIDKFNLKTVGNMIIDKEEELKNKGIYLINNQYYGMNINDKQLFQTFAFVSNILNPNMIFTRAKNYYLWEPNVMKMPQKAINYRWKYIATFCRKIVKQLETVHENGFILPHLRWEHLNLTHAIQNVLFPTFMDRNGNVNGIVKDNLLKIEDPYCPPQFFDKNKRLNYKYDSWIFGCLLYEFIWGHTPNSFIVQLLEYLKSRDSSYSLSEVLKMSEYPSDFIYQPFNFDKINSILSLEHMMKKNSVKENVEANIKYFGYRGILKPLEVMYGEDFMHYKEDFKIFQTLMHIITACLNPHQTHRLQLSQVLQQLSFIEDLDFQQYIQVLNSHQSGETLYKQVINPIIESERTNQFEKLPNLAEKLKQQLDTCLKGGRIKPIYIMPKKYSWGLNEDNEHESSIRANKEMIRSQLTFNTVCLLFNENVLSTLVLFYSKSEKQPSTFVNILQIFVMIFEGMKKYDNPFAAYVKQILDSLIQFFIDAPFSIDHPSQSIHDKQYFKMGDMKSKQKQKILNFMSNIIYVNGYGNIEYEVVHKFILFEERYRKAFEYLYAVNQLRSEEGEEKVLSLNFFRDRIGDQILKQLFGYLKPEVYVLQILLEEGKLIVDSLLFFFDLSTICSQSYCLQIFQSNIFYMHLGYLLHRPIENSQIKIIIIQTMNNLLKTNNGTILQVMNDTAFSIIRQLTRLLVEPPKNTPNHKEYKEIEMVLKETVEILEEMKEEIVGIEGLEFILKGFRDGYERRG